LLYRYDKGYIIFFCLTLQHAVILIKVLLTALNLNELQLIIQ
jgi:hypothetical protein